MSDRITAIISSTTRDLAEHRALVCDACLRLGVFPIMMEHLGARSAEKVQECLSLVDEAEVYVGIFANRYGSVPDGHAVSYTELEYDRAVERGIPRLIFMGTDDPGGEIPIAGDSATERLRALKERLLHAKDNIICRFSSPERLRGDVIQSLRPYAKSGTFELHNVARVPVPPEPYIAHPYSLMQVNGLIGRRPELQQLTDWVTNSQSEFYLSRVLSVVAIGGMGKSALTWKWFQEIAPKQLRPLAGRVWWSFYESDARFENFLTRTLAYASHRTIERVEELTVDEQVQELLDILDRQPFLIVLDGLERLMLAYARLDAARLKDEDLDEQTAHFSSRDVLPAHFSEPLNEQHRLRKVIDDRIARFLQRLTSVRRSRILISTRLAPADLQVDGIRDRLGSSVLPLTGLEDADALALWKARDGQVSDTVLSVLNLCDNHPLVIQVLASTVAKDRAARGDFNNWRRRRPDFHPTSLPAVQVRSHVLAFALDGLSERASQALRVLATFRMPTTYETLAALLVGDDRACLDEAALDETLCDLEDRGLLGWDRRANRYDLHPIARGVVWEGLDLTDRQRTCALLENHFAAMPAVPAEEIRSLDSLSPTLELFNALIGQERFDDAHHLFFERLATPLLRWLDAHRLRVQLLESLFPLGTQNLPSLKSTSDKAQALNSMSLAYRLSGRPGPAAVMSQLDVELLDQSGTGREDIGNGRGKLLGRGLRNFALALCRTGDLWKAENAARRAIVIDRDSNDAWASYWEALDLGWLAWVWIRTGRGADADRCLRRALRIMAHHDKPLSQARLLLGSARLKLWEDNRAAAEMLVDQASQLFDHVGDREKMDAGSQERELLRANRLRVKFLLADGRLSEAEEMLHEQLIQSRGLHLIEEEVTTLTMLAGLRHRQGRLDQAEELLGDVWSWVEFGPYRLLNADAQLVLSHVHLAAEHRDKAMEAALKSYDLACCDGSNHCYHWGVRAARDQLKKLGTSAPPLPTSATEFGTLIELEVDPPDQFFVGSDSSTQRLL